MEREKITDKQIQAQALQHLLIYYEKKRTKYEESKRDDLLNTVNMYIAKIRRTLIHILEN